MELYFTHETIKLWGGMAKPGKVALKNISAVTTRSWNGVNGVSLSECVIGYKVSGYKVSGLGLCLHSVSRARARELLYQR